MAARGIRIVERSAGGCVCEAAGPTGTTDQMVIAATTENVQLYIDGAGAVQEILRNIHGKQHEFLISGTTPEAWKAMFADED